MQKVRVGGLTFWASSVLTARAGELTTLLVSVPIDSEADLKLRAMRNADVFANATFGPEVALFYGELEQFTFSQTWWGAAHPGAYEFKAVCKAISLEPGEPAPPAAEPKLGPTPKEYWR